MSDIGVAEIPVDEDERPLPPPPAAGKERAGRRTDPAHAAVARLAQYHGVQRRHLCRDRRDLLYRPPRGRVARRDSAGVSLRDADHDDVGRRHGRRRGFRDRAGAWRRRQGSRRDACHACAADRPLLRADVHARHADIRRTAAGTARRPRQCAGAGRCLHADFLRRRHAALADANHGGNSARHRQHEAAVADDVFVGRLPDRSRRHAGSWPRSDPAHSACAASPPVR